jgi:hypothetical protein
MHGSQKLVSVLCRDVKKFGNKRARDCQIPGLTGRLKVHEHNVSLDLSMPLWVAADREKSLRSLSDAEDVKKFMCGKQKTFQIRSADLQTDLKLEPDHESDVKKFMCVRCK